MKKQLFKLAEKLLRENKKAFVPGKTTILYAGPVINSKEIISIMNSLISGWFGIAQETTLFEEKTAQRLGKRYGVFVNSGSSANLLALATLKELFCKEKKRQGKKIIIPAISFPTTLNPILQLGFEPIFVDVALGSYNMRDEQVMAALKDPAVAGIMFAHALGNPVAKTKTYHRLIKEKGGFLIEDCCDALGATYNNEPVGTHADAATLSLYVAHHITTGEGGIVAFSRKSESDIARSYRDWGRACFCNGQHLLSKKGACGKRFNDWLGLGFNVDHRYVYTRAGYNLKPLELQASMGLVQLEKLDEFIKKRKNNFKRMNAFMRKFEEFFILPQAEENTQPCWFSYPITIRTDAPFQRSEIVSFLENHKIQTRSFFGGNLLLQPAYRHLQSKNRFSLVNSSLITRQTFMIGIYPGITSEMLAYVFSVFDTFLKRVKK